MAEMGGAQLTQGELRMLRSRFPQLKIVGTRWVLTPEEPDFKAKLAVQGCQEHPTMMRTDSPTGSRNSFSWSILVQHRNIGVAVLLTHPLQTFKQGEWNGCFCS